MGWQQFNGLCALFVVSPLAWGADDEPKPLKAMPIRIESTRDVPADLKSTFYPPLKPGFRVTYLIEGERLAKFERITIRSIKTPDGTDLSKSYKSTQPWDGNITKDGKYFIFPISLDRPLSGKEAKLQIDGDVELQVGGDHKALEVELTDVDNLPRKLGPFTLIPRPNDRYTPSKGPASFIQHAPPPPRTPRPPDFKGSAYPQPMYLDTTVRSDPKVEYLWTVKVTGPEDRWIAIRFEDGTKEVKGLPYVSGEYLAFDLPKPSSGKLKVTIDQYGSTKAVKVPIQSLGEDD